MKLQSKRKIDKYLGYLLIFFFVPLTKLLGVVLRRNHRLQNRPQHIFFIKLMGLGSLVISIDAIRALKKTYPATSFILITDATIAAGIRPFGVFDEIWVMRSHHFIGMAGNAAALILRSWKRRQKWVVDLEVYSKLTTLFSLFTLAVNRFGFFLPPVFFRKYLNTHNILFNRFHLLEENYWRIAGAVARKKLDRLPAIISRTDEASKPFIAINNTCSDLALVRKMDEGLVHEIALWLLQHTRYQLAFLGAASDANENDKLIARLNNPSRLTNLAGVCFFEDYYRFLSEKTAFIISIDSAPLHIAKKLGLPTISVWGPTDPAHYLSLNKAELHRHHFVFNRVHCSPCVHHYSQPPCRGDNFCMKNITADAVIGKIRQLLPDLHLADGIKSNAPVPVR